MSEVKRRKKRTRKKQALHCQKVVITFEFIIKYVLYRLIQTALLTSMHYTLLVRMLLSAQNIIVTRDSKLVDQHPCQQRDRLDNWSRVLIDLSQKELGDNHQKDDVLGRALHLKEKISSFSSLTSIFK